MATPVELPQLGNTVEECLLNRWVKHKGDQVSAGDVVAEVETDKTNFEITAPVAGTVLDTFFEEGALVPVFAKLFVIGNPGEKLEDAPVPSIPVAETVPVVPQQESVTDTRRSTSDAQADKASHAPFSPRALRYVTQHGLGALTVAGSGPGGRVLEADVRRAHAESPRKPKSGGIRDVIARRMRESLASTAQYSMHASADATALLAARTRYKVTPAMAGVTINDLVTFCTIKALIDMPALNAEYIDGRIVPHARVHIGFAADTPRGLMVPVVRNADELSLVELSARIKQLSAAAVQGAISPDDLSGATFTISNLGVYGIESFTPLINPPQVAILGVGTIDLKPVRRNGSVEFVDTIGLSLTCDHQVIDGAPGARFLQMLKGKIESLNDA